MAQTKAQLVVGLNVNASAPASALQIDASGNVNLDSNTLYVDATNNRVGVGTTSPSSTLTVAGSAKVIGSTTGQIFIESNSGGYAGSINLGGTGNGLGYTAGELYFGLDNKPVIFANKASSGEAMRITGGGLVGIGVSSPSELLHLGSGGKIRLNRADNATGSTINDGGSNNGIIFNSLNNDGFTFQNGGTTVFKIDTATNGSRVGIGTTSPDVALHVATGNATGYIKIDGGTSSSATNGLLFRSGSNTYSAEVSHYQSNLSLYTAGTERARIDSSGRLLVGTSSAYDASTGLQVKGASGFNAGFLDLQSSWRSTIPNQGIGHIRFIDGEGGHRGSIECRSDGDSSSASDAPGRLLFSTTADGASSPTERMRISSSGGFTSTAVANDVHSFANLNSTTFNSTLLTLSTYRNTTNSSYAFFSCIRQGFAIALQILDSGNVLNANNSYGALSDLKLKENIVDAGSQWDDLKALKVRKYNFKEETGNPTHTQIGLIAQEVELVSPGLVYETPDRSEEGEHLDSVTKNVNYSVLYMKAVKALQEAMERIEQLEAKVSVLESKP